MVISDTTVLIALGRIGMLWLLKELWGTVVVPEAVYREAANDLPGGKEVADAVKSGWLQVKGVKTQETVHLLQVQGLKGRGECECIVLAKEIGAKAMLLDDKRARKTAQATGIEAVGTLALLVHAAKEGLLTKQDAGTAVKSLMEAGFRISKPLAKKTIQMIENI